MEAGSRRSELPPFSELDFPCPDPEVLLLSAREAASALTKTDSPEATRYALLEFQQLLFEWRSSENLKKVRLALAEDKAPQCKAVQAYTGLGETAQSFIYKALLSSPYEHLEHSGEDRDLWSQAWRWKHFLEPISLEEQVRERQICEELRQSRPLYAATASTLLGDPRNGFRSLDRYSGFDDTAEAFRSQAAERSDLFLELFECRKAHARLCSFPDFAEYWAERRGRRSLGRRETRRFIFAFRQYFLPLIQEVLRLRRERLGEDLHSALDLLRLIPGEGPTTEAEQLTERTIQSLREVTRQERSYLSQLLERGYVSFESRVRERLGKSALLFPSLPSAFLCLPALHGIGSAAGIFPALGEAIAEVSAMLNYHMLGSSSQDAFSRSLSAAFFLCLGKDCLHRYFSEDAELAFDLEWTQRILRLPFLLALHEFEDRIYCSGSRLTLRELNRFWLEMRSRWLFFLPREDLPFFTQGFGWQIFMARPEDPYAAIGEALGLTAALAGRIHKERHVPLTDHFNRYLLSNPGSPLRERLESSGLENPSEEAAVRKAAFSVCDLLRL